MLSVMYILYPVSVWITRVTRTINILIIADPYRPVVRHADLLINIVLFFILFFLKNYFCPPQSAVVWKQFARTGQSGGGVGVPEGRSSPGYYYRVPGGPSGATAERRESCRDRRVPGERAQDKRPRGFRGEGGAYGFELKQWTSTNSKPVRAGRARRRGARRKSTAGRALLRFWRVYRHNSVVHVYTRYTCAYNVYIYIYCIYCRPK